MKTTLMTRAAAAGAAACLAASAAHAQSSVTLYGNLDTGLTYFNNVGGKHFAGTEDGNFIPDFFGLQGSEDLGGGLSAIFKLEAGFLLSSGKFTVANQLFQREATVGLSSARYGTLKLGHQPSFMFDVLSPLSTGYIGGGFPTFHQGNLDELANTFEFDNSAKYLSPSYAGLSFGAQFGFGNQAGNFANGRNYGFTVQYKNGPLKLGAVYANENDRYLEFADSIGLRSLLGTPLPAGGMVANRVQNWGAGGSYALGNWLLHAMFTQTRIDMPTASANANTVDAGVSYTLATVDTIGVGGAVENLDGGHWVTLSLSNLYSISKRTLLYQQAMYQRASGANAVAALLGAGQASGRSQVGLAIGIQHFF
ncbi:porin [Paraburkholderia acidisoli]|uniref:Porin n=1 Tax=Paraburkholderia acidisoli TaxID=2571748 RepID=A0A7Z2JJ53_9BURK|nr:porin [Paraburkholderia acidisoli]QGZ65015.1 porin [Paraburkholderia acidisoli]